MATMFSFGLQQPSLKRLDKDDIDAVCSSRPDFIGFTASDGLKTRCA
jgi:hypothetical protein